ncbi:MAG: hypothetical protein V3V41_00185 [Candidatus Heimdallarchaeota archaeon]
MVFVRKVITLLDKTQTNTTPSSDLPASVTGTTDGDMEPWVIRLDLKNQGTEKVNGGVIKLRVDELKTFINTSAILVDEFTKTKYLIEAQLFQQDPNGGPELEGKLYRFHIGTPQLDVDKNFGSILTLSLQEDVPLRSKETVTSIEHRFETPDDSFIRRINEFNNFQGGDVAISAFDIRLPTTDDLKQFYIPQSPRPVHDLFNELVKGLSQPKGLTGVFEEFYFDFDPEPTVTRIARATATKTGTFPEDPADLVILDPLSFSASPIDASEEQSAITDNVRYKNNVIIRGDASAGSLPVDHSRFASNYTRATGGSRGSDGLGRPEWDGTNSVTDPETGNTFNYLAGALVKTTTDSGTEQDIIRFFRAIDNTGIAGGPNNIPDQDDADWVEDFVIIPEWNKEGRYFDGDVVYQIVGSTVKFFKAQTNILNADIYQDNAGEEPDNGFPWDHLDPLPKDRSTNNFAGFKTYSPWTESIEDWEKNLGGLASGSLPDGPNANFPQYTGFACDWTVTRDTYTKQDITTEFETVSSKVVTRAYVDDESDLVNGTADKYHGMRVLLSDNPTGQFVIDFNKQVNGETSSPVPPLPLLGAQRRIAQFDKVDPKQPNGVWKFSRVPFENESVADLNTGKVLRHVGDTATGSWGTEASPNAGWDVFQGSSSILQQPQLVDKPSPFHIVKNIYKDEGSNGQPDSAITQRFTWGTGFDLADGRERLTSRGVWLNMWYPFPRISTNHDFGSQSGETFANRVGHEYGLNGDDSQSRIPYINTFNVDQDRFGNVQGWNTGLDAEDMGRIVGLKLRLKAGFFRDTDAFLGDNIPNPNRTNLKPLNPVTGMANIPFTFWAVDLFDRIWFFDFQLRRNDQWEVIEIPFGQLSMSRKLFFGRWNELPQFWGYVVSVVDFTLKEKEFSGVAFDWRFVKGWGVQWKGAYAERGYYEGGTKAWLDEVTQQFEQGFGALQNLVVNPIVELFTNEKPTRANAIVRNATLSIEDPFFIKELVVNSDEDTVPDARTKVEIRVTEDDYEGARILARSRQARLSFFPQFYHMRSTGDVRLRLGHAFKVRGDRVPSGEQDLVCSEVSHIWDHTGYHMEVLGERKFVTTGE